MIVLIEHATYFCDSLAVIFFYQQLNGILIQANGVINLGSPTIISFLQHVSLSLLDVPLPAFNAISSLSSLFDILQRFFEILQILKQSGGVLRKPALHIQIGSRLVLALISQDFCLQKNRVSLPVLIFLFILKRKLKELIILCSNKAFFGDLNLAVF